MIGVWNRIRDKENGVEADEVDSPDEKSVPGCTEETTVLPSVTK